MSTDSAHIKAGFDISGMFWAAISKPFGGILAKYAFIQWIIDNKQYVIWFGGLFILICILWFWYVNFIR